MEIAPGGRRRAGRAERRRRRPSTVDGQRIDTPDDGRRRRQQLRSSPARWPGSASSGRASRSSCPWPRSSASTRSRSRTRSSPTSDRSSSATATRCSWCCARRPTSTTSEEVEFGEIHVFVGPNFVLTVRHSRTPDLGAVRHRMENDPELLALGPGGRAVRDPRQRRRRLRAGRRRPAEGHRRDRDPGLPRRSQGVAADLRAVRRGDRVPARRRGRCWTCSRR